MLGQPGQFEIYHNLIIHPSTKSASPHLSSHFFILAHSFFALLHSHFCFTAHFYFIHHYFFTGPLRIINAGLKSFKVDVSFLSGWPQGDTLHSTHLLLSYLKRNSSDINIWTCVCVLRCERMRSGQRWLCRGMREHQRLLALWVRTRPCAGWGWTHL